MSIPRFADYRDVTLNDDGTCEIKGHGRFEVLEFHGEVITLAPSHSAISARSIPGNYKLALRDTEGTTGMCKVIVPGWPI